MWPFGKSNFDFRHQKTEIIMKHFLLSLMTVFLGKPEIEGVVNLYRKISSVREPGSAEETRTYHYWIDAEQSTEVNRFNYKPLVKKYLPKAKGLHKKLGKPGFQYENLPSMILYYNRFFGQAQSMINRLDRSEMLLRD